VWLGGNVGVVLFDANAWRVEWANSFFPILTMLCLWLCLCYEIVPNMFVFLVQWSLTCLHEWCVHWISKLLDYDIKCGITWMGIWFKHMYRNLNFCIARISIMMHCHYIKHCFVFLWLVLFFSKLWMMFKDNALKHKLRLVKSFKQYFLHKRWWML